MVVAAAIIGGAALVGTVGAAAIASSSAKSAAREQGRAAQTAAEAQVQAQEIATEELRRQFDISQEALRPYREVGGRALARLEDQMGGYLEEQFSYPLSAFTEDPGFQFRVSEGMKAIERSAAARGGVLGGRQLKDITRFGQDIASAEYNQAYTRAFNEFMTNRTTRFNRLAALAGIGQTATVTGAQIGTQTGQGLANIFAGTGARLSDIALQAGNVRAAGQIGAVSPYASALSSLGQLPGQYFALQQAGLLGGGTVGGGTVGGGNQPILL